MKIAFIGTGNMGGALAHAASLDKENELYLCNRHPEKAEKLQKEIGGKVVGYSEAVTQAQLIFLGVKPIALPGLCETLRPLLSAKSDAFTIVSMVAGVTLDELKELLDAPADTPSTHEPKFPVLLPVSPHKDHIHPDQED